MRIRKTSAVAIGALSVALAALTVGPAQAAQFVPAADNPEVVAAAGSDTIVDVMNQLTSDYNALTTHPGVSAVNIPVLATTDAPAFNAPGDASCPPRTYVNRDVASPPTTFPAPNGSTDGKNALQGNAPWPTDNLTTDCIGVARSSSGPGPSDPATFEYYAFGLDAVTWAHFPGGHAPNSLSIQNIRDIYSCQVTNWNQVGGTSGPISRYIPQAGSGTRTFFVSVVLGGNEPSTACGPVTETEEHDARTIPDADKPNAITPFSVAQFVAQANGVISDKRNGIVLGLQNGFGDLTVGTAPNLAPNPAVVNEGSGFTGVRRVYNVLDSRLANYPQALAFAGFVPADGDNPGPGYICSADAQSAIQKFGFASLGEDPNLPGNFCRAE